MPSLDELAANPARAATLSGADQRRVILKMSVISAAIASAVERETTPAVSTPDPNEERLLGADEAAAMLDLSPATLLRNKDRYPFTVKDGRSVKFSLSGIRRWIRGKAGR